MSTNSDTLEEILYQIRVNQTSGHIPEVDQNSLQRVLTALTEREERVIREAHLKGQIYQINYMAGDDKIYIDWNSHDIENSLKWLNSELTKDTKG